jgi:2Fe-2S ferredoxin
LGGLNPYIHDPDVAMPTKKYRIVFLPMNRTVEVDPKDLPYGLAGLAGSILDTAMNFRIELDHACGGVCACSTCHIIVREGGGSCNPPSEEEEDQLDDAYGLTPRSRLACQCVPTGEMDLVVEIPGWNRNLAREGE